MELTQYLTQEVKSVPNPNFYEIARKAIDLFDLSDSVNAISKRASRIYKKEKLNTTPSEQFLLNEYLHKHGINPENVVEAKFINHLKSPSVNIKTKYTKEDKTVDDIINTLEDLINKCSITPVILPEPSLIKNEDKKAFCFWSSDKHVGAETKENSIYQNNYNREVFASRMTQSLEPYKEAYSLFGKFDKVIYADLGDSMDGWDGYTTRGGHKLPQNMTNPEAFQTYVEETVFFFDQLISLNMANSYEFIAQVNDNHGGDFSHIANDTVCKILNLKYPQVKTTIITKFIDYFIYGAHGFMLCHGKDNEDLKNGLPLNPDEKTSNYIKQYIDTHLAKVEFKHFIKGDLHKSNSHTLNWGRYKNVLSLYGASKWIHNNFGNSKGGLCYEIVWKHRNKIFSDEIFF